MTQLSAPSVPRSPISLYLHIPFCRYRCSYCDFNTYTGLSDLQQPYVDALRTEIDQVRTVWPHPNPPQINTVFFGGGTPSVLTAAQVRAIMDRVRARFDLLPTAEVTMEANPETVDEAYLSAVREAGVNRLSFGAQSVVPQELALLGREHDFQTVIQAVEAARTAGFDNYNIDLIYGVPGQTVESWMTSVQAALDLQTTHLSLYCLTVEPGTPLHGRVNRGDVPPPDPDLAADQYEVTQTALAAAGFDHYEISNWCRPGLPSRHNMAYWRNVEYLGLGAGAHGRAGGHRYRIVRRPRQYINAIAGGNPQTYPLSTAVADAHRPEPAEDMSDTMIMGLRLLVDGLDTAAFAGRYGVSVYEQYGDEIERLVEQGLLEQLDDGRRLRLTPQGRFVSNRVFVAFV